MSYKIPSSLLVKTALIVGVMGLGAPSAHAGGFLADTFIKPIFGKHAAREADKVNEQLGKPVDKVAQAAEAAAAAAAAALGGGN
jgi:hypothetical protein